MAGAVVTAADGGAAVLAGVTGRAGAGEVVHAILTGAAVLTRVDPAVVNVVLTVGAGVAILTLAQVGVDEVHTLGTIRAGVGAAVVDLLLTVEASVPQRALAEVTALRVVDTAAVVEARPVSTRHGAQLTVVSIETRRTGALVGVFLIRAASSVPAGVVGALIDLLFTAGPGEAWTTGAGVATLSSVGTSCPVHAGLVVGAVVQVLVAEEASPTLLTVALPRLLAGAMETARVPDAVVTITPTEAHSTLAFSRLLTETMFIVTAWQADRFCAVLSFPA